MRVKHSTEKVVESPVGMLDLADATQVAMDKMLAQYFDKYDDSQPMTVTVSIEGETR
jgi:hypothetical protein